VNLYDKCGIHHRPLSDGLRDRGRSTPSESDDEVDEGKPNHELETQKAKEIRAFNRNLVKTYKAKAKGRRYTVVFSATVALSLNLVKAFNDAGIKASSVSSDTLTDKRKEIIESFKNGHLPVLVNCKVIMEGCDIPAVSVHPIRRTSDLS
jgi:superfamily II DNA or RNA helicase